MALQLTYPQLQSHRPTVAVPKDPPNGCGAPMAPRKTQTQSSSSSHPISTAARNCLKRGARGLSGSAALADIGPRPHLAPGRTGRRVPGMGFSITMKSRSLLTQILVVNIFLIAVTVFLAAIVVSPTLHEAFRGRAAFVLGGALLATMLGNWVVLRRRFKPLDDVISAMESIELAAPEQRRQVTSRRDSSEVRRLGLAFERMRARLEAQRREAGRAAIQAQERERRRIAQDLHDEVNQALTAVSLRLQASIERASPELRRELGETKRLATQAMEELLALARQLRPAVLDDHGLIPALHSQVRDFSEQTGIVASFNTRGSMPRLTPEQQLVIYRVTQEGLSNVAQHANAHKVDVELSFIGRTVLRICDDGTGFSQLGGVTRNGGLGVLGMRERALLIGGHLSLWSSEGEGTRVELTINQ